MVTDTKLNIADSYIAMWKSSVAYLQCTKYTNSEYYTMATNTKLNIVNFCIALHCREVLWLVCRRWEVAAAFPLWPIITLNYYCLHQLIHYQRYHSCVSTQRPIIAIIAQDMIAINFKCGQQPRSITRVLPVWKPAQRKWAVSFIFLTLVFVKQTIIFDFFLKGK